MTTPDTINYNEITESKDSADRPVGFVCEYHVGEGNGKISSDTGVEVSSYYDYEYDCTSSTDTPPANGPLTFASRVVENIANDFRIMPDGQACTVPNTPIWLIGLNAAPDDTVVPNFECQELQPSSGRCCAVVHAPMTLWWANRRVQELEVMSMLREQFDSPTVTAGTNYRIKYIGAIIENGGQEDGRDNLPPAINDPTPPPPQGGSTNFTVIGGFVLGGLLAVFLGAVFVLVRRRRRLKKAREIDVAVQKSTMDLDEQGSGGVTLEIDVMSDDVPPNLRNSFDPQHPYDHEDYAATPNSYTFDLANSFKNDVMGTYGSSSGDFPPTSMAVVPPYPMEETSDSEVDSWAQTDGTVGSLEERLEEITAEI